MKFKVGDKVRVRKDLTGGRYYDGLWVNSDMEGYRGKVDEIKHANGNNYVLKEADYSWNDAMLEKILTKDDLFRMPIGTKVYTDADDECYREWIKVSASRFFNYSGDEFFSDYELDDLKDGLAFGLFVDKDFGNRIIKVEEPEYKTAYEYSPELKEMTIAEIEKELGYPIKVVKESEDN